MNTISYADVRKQLGKTMKRVCDDHMPVVVTRPNAPPVVMVSLDDYHAAEETAYLLRSPANARRLREAIMEIEKGTGEPR